MVSKVEKWGYSYLIELKKLWEKEKLLVTGNLSFFHNVFNSRPLLMRQNEYLWSKGLIPLQKVLTQVSQRMLTLAETFDLVNFVHFKGSYNANIQLFVNL